MKKVIRVLSALFLCLVMSAAFNVNAKGSEKVNVTVSENETETKKDDKKENGKKVYFAAPMFNDAEKKFNLKVVKVLEDHGYEVFLPQRDGIEAALLEGKTEEELIKMIFELDAGEVQKADIVFMNLDGRVPDEGACVELGIAYAGGKRCYGFKTDTRAVERELELNPMISGCMIKIFQNYDGDQLLKEIDQYLSENEL